MKTTKIISGIMSLALVFGIAIPLADGTFRNSSTITANAAVRNEKISKKYSVPSWYNVDLSKPVWEGKYSLGFSNGFDVDLFFPDEYWSNMLKSTYKDPNFFDNYKCAATIIRHSDEIPNCHEYGYTKMSVIHIFVPKNTTELEANWEDSKNDNGIYAFSTKERVIVSTAGKYKGHDHDTGSSCCKKIFKVSHRDKVYSSIPIVIEKSKNKAEQTIEPNIYYGDLNDDGSINVNDISMLASHINGFKKLEGMALKAADVNNDGEVNYDDLSALADHIRGIKPINQVATDTTASTASSTTISDASTIVETGTEVIEPVWKPAERFESFDFDEYKALLDEDVKNYPIRKDESIEQAYVEVMMKQVNNSHYCDQVPDEEWEKFCLLFNEKVKELYYENPYNFTPEIHYFRNRLNRAPETLNGLLKENAEYYRKHGINKWKMMDAWASSYHMFNTRACNNEGVFNLKFVSENGLYEAVYDKMGYSLNETDPINMGTYNYGDPSNMLDHMYMDVFPYTNQSYDSIISGFSIIQSITTKDPISSFTISGFITEELLTGKIICRGWLNTPDSDHFECSDMINNYESFLSDNAAQERRAKYESMLNNHEYIGEDGEIRR